MGSSPGFVARASAALDERVKKIEARLNRHFEDLKASIKNGKDGERGPRGPEGPPGPKGDKPKHEWRGSKLRFEKPDGTWGKYVDLQGPPGRRGGSGGSGGSFSPGALAKLVLPVKDADTVLIERNGTAYRVSVLELKDVFGQGGGDVIPGQVYAGDIPIYADYESVTASE